MPRLRHFENLSTARAINFSCYKRYSLLRSEAVILPFVTELERARQNHGIHILGYVIMPNHVHIILHPTGELELGPIIGEIKARSARTVLTRWREERSSILERLRVIRQGKTGYAFWQARCYDHNCRTVESVREKIAYCHLNPVRAGLVAAPGDWRWSSYRWYHGMDDIVLEIDGIEL